ncbi:MAG: transcription termination/antitermination NusG family protein [Candidatus Binatia bacterium]
MKRWYAVYTQPRNESLATEHLARQSFDAYCPRYQKRRSHAGRIDFVSSPLFPRYVFVAFDPETARWQAIRSTRGVVDLVRNGLDPVPVPEFIISEIRTREDENGFVLLGNHLKLARGDKFSIAAGPFAGHVAIFEARRDSARVIALLSLLGGKIVVELPVGAVAPVT